MANEQIQRFGFWHDKEWAGQPGEFELMPEGPYVLHADHLSITNAMRENQAVLAQQLTAKDAEIEVLKKEIAFRDFAKARESNIAINYGPYSEVQNALSSEISLHQAWRKRAEEAEQENTSLREQVARLSAPVSDEEWSKFAYSVKIVRPKDFAETTMMEHHQLNALILARKEGR